MGITDQLIKFSMSEVPEEAAATMRTITAEYEAELGVSQS